MVYKPYGATMNQGSDVELLVKGLVAQDWRQQFPNDACDSTNTHRASGAKTIQKPSKTGQTYQRWRPDCIGKPKNHG